MLDRRMWRHYDYSLLAVVIMLLGVGVAMVYAASFGDPEIARTPVDQAVTGLVGIIALVLISILDYTLLKNLAWPIYLVVLIALALVIVPGIGTLRYGARRWFTIGTLDLQPGEFAKILMTIVLAKFIADRQGKRPYLETVALSLLLIVPCVGLILRQPNLSTALTIVFVWLVQIFVGGINRQHVGIIVIAGIAIVLLVWNLGLVQDYQLRRIELLLNPSPENLEAGERYQVEKALDSLGSGGWWGQGYLQGASSQLRYLPVRHTDFIFSVLGEQLGFVGAMILIAMLIFVIVRSLRSAYVARDLFGQLLCVGIAATLFLQSYINIGMQVGIMPVTGVVLPFISYGRSSLIVLLAAVGIIQSVAMRHKRLEF
jgi:rod shape determining protein RodA